MTEWVEQGDEEGMFGAEGERDKHVTVGTFGCGGGIK